MSRHRRVRSKLSLAIGLVLVVCLLISQSLSAALAAQVSEVVITPEPYAGPLRNPLMGFLGPPNGRHEYATLSKAYVKWNEIEASADDGVEKLRAYADAHWKGVEERNIKIVPRVFLEWPKGDGATSYWPIDSYWPADMPRDFGSAQFKKRLVRMIQKMGEAWDDDPRIAFIETGMIGPWGEQHHPSPDAEMQKLIGDAYTNAFKHKLLMNRYPWEFKDYQFGIYWDSFGNPGWEMSRHVPELEGSLADRWKIAPMAGETAFSLNPDSTKPRLGANPTEAVATNAEAIVRYIRRWHWTGLGWISNYDPNNADAAAGAARIQSAFGYRFVIDEVRFPSRVEPGGPLHVAFKVRNLGSAPFYYQWPVEVSLLDKKSHEPIWKATFKDVDIRSWLPGDFSDKGSGRPVGEKGNAGFEWKTGLDYDIAAISNRVAGSFELPKKLPRGEYILALAILDPAGNLPAVKFAIKNYFQGGRHPMGAIGVGTRCRKAELEAGTFDNLAADHSLHYSNNVVEPAASPRLRSNSSPAERLSLDFDWRFNLDDQTNASSPSYDDSHWRKLDVPHDWSIEGPFRQDNKAGRAGGYAPLGVGWYRRSFELSREEGGRKVFLDFDGVFVQADVWVNGQKVGHNDFGYLGFQCDVTAAARFGATNVLAVRVENSIPASRWYTGSGIYRHVWLETTKPLHISHWGTYVTTPRVTKSSANIVVKSRVRNDSGLQRDCLLTTDICREGNATVLATAETRTNLAAGTELEIAQSFTVEKPRLWSPETPTLYRAVSQIGQQAKVYETPFGIRTIKFDPDTGFSLNGQKVVLKGVCIHHDNGALGSASFDRAIERRLEVLKTMGCNAVRLSHNPHSPELLDLCDRMGLFVFDEAFDKWNGFKPDGEGWRERLGNFIARDRNHPSVVIWSIGNEVKEQAKPEGTALAKSMVEFVHAYEPTRPVTCALHPGRGLSLELPAMAEALDVVSMNYQAQLYDADHKKRPQMVILGSETLPYYAYNVSHKGDHDKFMTGNSWFALNKYVAGQFIWAGIDYLGESSGWPCKGWPMGLVDTCGFRKEFSYYQESLQSEKPMVRIVVFDPAGGDVPGKKGWGWPKMASHWNWAGAGETLKVGIFANCPRVELVLNGKSLGEKKLADFSDRIITWQVPNQPGTLRAIGRKDGKVVCSHELRTAGEPVKIVLLSDRDRLLAGEQDLANIEVNLVDAAGILVPNSDSAIKFEVTGPAVIIGVDNGDLDSPEPYQASQRTTRAGKCLAVLRIGRGPGRIAFTASAPGLPPATIY